RAPHRPRLLAHRLTSASQAGTLPPPPPVHRPRNGRIEGVGQGCHRPGTPPPTTSTESDTCRGHRLAAHPHGGRHHRRRDGGHLPRGHLRGLPVRRGIGRSGPRTGDGRRPPYRTGNRQPDVRLTG